jgi:tRNA pseudouridine55 synthase
MATGVLPLLLGRMTRLARFYVNAEKSYEGSIRFGFATDTYDAQGEPLSEPRPVSLTLDQVREAAKDFVGKIEQVPPPFSAKKIAGVPAYKLARKKKPVTLEPATVEVQEFEILAMEGEYARFRARVASGTYLRSIAHDLGKRLGPGAHLAELRRTAVGEFSLEQSIPLRSLEDLATDSVSDNGYSVKHDISQYLLHPRGLLPQFPAVTVPVDALPRLLHGNALNLPEFSRASLVKVFRDQTELVAIARRIAGTLFHPEVVLAAPVPATEPIRG